jgi:hypothetical protein
MRIGRVACLSFLLALTLGWGRHGAEAQQVRVEVGGGWAIPSSDIVMRGVSGDGREGTAAVNPASGGHVYGAVGRVWTLSDNFNLEGRLRGQYSQMTGRFENFGFSNEPDGELVGITFEGQITLTSVGRINPYLLVGLGVVRTTFEGVNVTDNQGTEVQFSEVDVTDGGGDVGVGATMPLAGTLLLTGEIRAAGSLPGEKENAVSVFPFSLGLSYGF